MYVCMYVYSNTMFLFMTRVADAIIAYKVEPRISKEIENLEFFESFCMSSLFEKAETHNVTAL